MKLNKIQIVLIKKETAFQRFFCPQSFQCKFDGEDHFSWTKMITVGVNIDKEMNIRFPVVELSSKPHMC